LEKKSRKTNRKTQRRKTNALSANYLAVSSSIKSAVQEEAPTDANKAEKGKEERLITQRRKSCSMPL